MKKFFGKRSVAALTAFLMMLSIISLPTGTALAAPGEAKLSSLSIKYGDTELIESFSPDNNSYTINVANSVDTVDISAVAEDEGASIYLAEQGGSTGPLGSVSLDVGDNNYQVTCIYNSESFIYFITINRADALPDAVNIAVISGVTPPVRDAVPVRDITETVQYTGSVTWSPDNNPFAASTVYTATITLTPKTGYTLTGVAENIFTVEGADSVSNAADSGVITAIFPATGAAEAEGGTETEGDYQYSVTDGKATITGYTGDGGNITIPDTLGGCPVTVIGNFVFYDNQSITGVVIPEGVTKIEYAAFDDVSNLVTVSLPDTLVSIEGSAFFNTGITSVNIPVNVTTIGIEAFGAFGNCFDLTAINVDPQNTAYSSVDGVLFNKAQTELLQYPIGLDATSYTIPSGVTIIGDYAFRNSSLESVVIPYGATEIGEGAFWKCDKLESANIPGSVTKIGEIAFIGCGLQGINIPAGTQDIGAGAFAGCKSPFIDVDASNGYYASVDGVLFDKGITTLLTYPAGKSGISYTIPDTVTVIEQEAFRTSLLKFITIPDGVTSIRERAFEFCWYLLSIEIPDSVTEMDRAFAYCTGLTEAIFLGDCPATTVYEFDGCDNLTIYYVAGKAGYTSPWHGYNPVAFDPAEEHSLTYDANGGSGSVPDGGSYAYGTAVTVSNADGLTGEFEGWNTKEDGSGASYAPGDTYRMGPHDVTLYAVWAQDEEGTETEGDYKYTVTGGKATIIEYTGGGGDITTPATLGGFTVTAIGSHAFEGNESITSVTIPEGVTDIEGGAFDSCRNLETISLPESLINIGNNAFGLTKIPVINIPKNVTSIGQLSVSCYWLEAINVDPLNTAYSSISGVLFNKDQTEILQYPIEREGTSYTIPDGVTSIGDDAFQGSDNLESVVIPDSVTSIGSYAFNFCYSLQYINIPAGIETIGSSNFAGCMSLSSINVDPLNGYYASVDGVLFDKDITTLLQYPAGKSGISYSIPDTVTIIGEHAFAQTGLKAVAIPDGVTSIESYAFIGCEGLRSIEIPDSVTEIGDAFMNCYSLIGAIFLGDCPDTTEYVFNGCDNLTIYYVAGKTGFPEGEWNGHPIYPFDPAAEYSFTYDANGGSGSVPAVGSYAYSEWVTISDAGELTKQDCTFAGWNTKEDGSGVNFAPGDTYRMVPHDVTLYAFWQTQFSSDCSLKSLSVSSEGEDLPLDQVFDPETLEYSLTVHFWVQYLDIIAEPNKESAEVYPDWAGYLEVGENTIYINVYDWEYGESRQYTLTVTRLNDMNTYLTPDGFLYEDRGEYLVILNYFGDATDIVVPTEITNPDTLVTKPVTAIGRGAFTQNTKIRSVTLQEGITRIGENSFNSCPNLQSVTFPAGLKSIGNYTFCWCYNLQSVTFPEGLISIGNGAFMDCENLGNVTLPDSVEVIGQYAFRECASLTSFALPENVSDIGEPFLYMCPSLETISVSEENPYYTAVDGVLFNANMDTLLRYPAAKAGMDYTIPDDVEDLYDAAFESCGLESVTIPENVYYISFELFENCENLTHVSLPEGIYGIGPWAFKNCTSLGSITFPQGLEDINGGAFENCTSLESVTLPENLWSIGGGAFMGCVNLSEILVDENNEYFTSQDGVLYSYDEEEDENTLVIFPAGKGTSFTVPSFVDKIGDSAFSNSLIQSIDLGSVSVIDWEAFRYCDRLTNVVIPDSVEYIGECAFESCKNLCSATLGTGLDVVGASAFANSEKLAALYFLTDAPDIEFDAPFQINNTYITIYYASGTTGFSNPWQGYPTQMFDPDSKCTVTYNMKGAPCNIPASAIYKGGKAVQPLDPVWAGHKFLGWFKDSSCTIPWNFAKNKITTGITLYAGWTQENNAYLDSLIAYRIYKSEFTEAQMIFNREFNPTVYSYTAKLEEGYDAFSVSATPSYEGATVTIDGQPVSSKKYNVQNGETVTSTIVVTSGTLKKTYTLTVTREKSQNNFLMDIAYSAGALTPKFHPDVTSYDLTLDEFTPSVTITPEKMNDLSKLYIDGYLKTSKTYNVDTGHSKTCTIKVVSQSGAAKIYTVKITRNKSKNADLTNIKTNYTNYKVTPAFSAGTTDYTLYLPGSISSVTLYAVKADKFASTTFIYGTSSWATSYKTFSVAYGTQKDVVIRVTAQDGTTQNYTVHIIRAPKIYSFSATPRPGTYAELSPGGDNVMTFKWTQYGPGWVTIQVNDGTDWYAVYSSDNIAGTHTATWDGRIMGAYLAQGTYKARISVSNLGTPPVFKGITFKIKPAPTLTVTASPASFQAGGAHYTKLIIRWNVVTYIKVEVYDSENTLVTTLWAPASYRYAGSKVIYWYGKDLPTGAALPAGNYTIKVTAGTSTATSAVTITP